MSQLTAADVTVAAALVDLGEVEAAAAAVGIGSFKKER